MLGLDERRIEFGLERGILLGEFGHRLEVAGGARQLLVRLDEGIGDLELLDGSSGVFLIVPESRFRLFGFELVARDDFRRDVKESPATEPGERTGRRSADGDRDSLQGALLMSVSGKSGRLQH
jgi:hypothetical protein